MSYKTILTIGTGYSGSTAIYNNFQIQKKFHDPFANKEFTITYDPCGIVDIEKCIYENYSISKANFIYKNFIDNFFLYTEKDSGLNPGKNFPNPDKILKKFIKYAKEIINYEYEGITAYLKYKNCTLENIKLKFFNKKNKLVFFKELKDFNLITQNFFFNLLDSNNRNVILDQGANIYDLHNSSKYYQNPHCILVFRDPRDIFSEFKFKTAYSYPKDNVDIFCKWYESSMHKIHSQNFKNVKFLKINFEDFILKNKKILEKISNFLSIYLKPDHKKFNFIRSRNNIYKYKKLLSNNEKKIIEKKLSKYLYKF